VAVVYGISGRLGEPAVIFDVGNAGAVFAVLRPKKRPGLAPGFPRCTQLDGAEQRQEARAPRKLPGWTTRTRSGFLGRRGGL
jgi:hypothetical protein